MTHEELELLQAAQTNAITSLSASLSIQYRASALMASAMGTMKKDIDGLKLRIAVLESEKAA